MEVVYQCAARGEQRAAVAQEGIAVEGWRRRLITAVASRRCLTTRRMLAVAVVVVNACSGVRVHQLSRCRSQTRPRGSRHTAAGRGAPCRRNLLGTFSETFRARLAPPPGKSKVPLGRLDHGRVELDCSELGAAIQRREQSQERAAAKAEKEHSRRVRLSSRRAESVGAAALRVSALRAADARLLVWSAAAASYSPALEPSPSLFLSGGGLHVFDAHTPFAEG